MKERRVVQWHNLGIFTILSREFDLFYQAVEPVWLRSESSLAPDLLKEAIFSNMKDKAQPGTRIERDLVQKVAEVE